MGRAINYLRLSITDRCNLRCRYCYSSPPARLLSRPELLSYEELETVVREAVRLGITKVRLTGGEPLLRKGAVEFAARLGALRGLEQLCITTNGILLADCARQLVAAGVSRVNISLDTLDHPQFARIAGEDRLDDVLRGLEAAVAADFAGIKINAVVLAGVNEDQVIPLAGLTRDLPIEVRFIEVMRLGGAAPGGEGLVPGREILERMRRRFKIAPLEADGGVARRYRIAGHRGAIGLITPISESFCDACNKLRVTADGHLKLCLFSDTGLDLKTALRTGPGVRGLLRDAMASKAASAIEPNAGGRPGCGRTMREIGG